MLIGYAKHSVVYKFIILKSDVLDCNTTIETKNVEFFEHIFSLCDKISHVPAEKISESTSKIEELRSKMPRREYFFTEMIFKLFLLTVSH